MARVISLTRPFVADAPLALATVAPARSAPADHTPTGKDS
jgi:hypothetical protein